MMILVTLFAGDGHKRRELGYGLHGQGGNDDATGNQRLLGSTWLPISSSVMEKGHVEDGYERREPYHYHSRFVFLYRNASKTHTQDGNFSYGFRKIFWPQSIYHSTCRPGAERPGISWWEHSNLLAPHLSPRYTAIELVAEFVFCGETYRSGPNKLPNYSLAQGCPATAACQADYVPIVTR